MKEYNDYLILGVPTRFFRDWIVSRYLDKILEQVKSFKLSLNRIEFKIIEEVKQNQELAKINELKIDYIFLKEVITKKILISLLAIIIGIYFVFIKI